MSDARAALAFTLAAWIKVDGELAAWRRLGVRPRLWWRDDDARRPSAALDRLLTLAGGRPVALAVIPDGDLSALAARLSGAQSVSVGQHGVDHTNRRPSGAPSEYAEPPTLAAARARISAGHASLLDAGLAPTFYTPPWNAVDPNLAAALSAMGFPLLSAGPVQVVHADLNYASAEIDVLSWKHGARFRGPMRVMSSLRRALADRRLRGDLGRPIGLLTHHLDHDEPAWAFLERAMGWFDARFDWIGVADIPPTARPVQIPTRETSIDDRAAQGKESGAPMAHPLAV